MGVEVPSVLGANQATASSPGFTAVHLSVVGVEGGGCNAEEQQCTCAGADPGYLRPPPPLPACAHSGCLRPHLALHQCLLPEHPLPV